jgi:hypothetical protein
MPDELPLPVLQELLQLVWNRDRRAALEASGLTVSPVNFYSSIPSIQQTMDSFEYQHGNPPPYLDARLFDAERMRAELASLLPYTSEFEPPTDGDEETCTNYFWGNSQFSYSDAMSLYAYVRRIQPKSIVEIGAGFSSLVSLEALRRNGTGRLLCIEPYPRPFISRMHTEGALDLQGIRAQDVTAELLNSTLADGDILFIDSTHTVKTGSDCLHIYLRLLPYIEKKIFVHVHDIFLPFGLPMNWLLDSQIYWTEQYLLMAFLIDNPRVKVLYGSAYNAHFNVEPLREQTHGRTTPGGSSFWFEYDGRR